MIRLQNIVPLTDFQRNAASFLKKMDKDGLPLVLTVNGRARAVIRSASEWDRLSDADERAELDASLLQAIKDVDEGRTRPAEEVFAELKAKYFGADGKPKRRRKTA
ncbi:MAG: type II toxin-antitoxin system Phd/YefM family antitoxin [Phycisphaerales bacterium]|nr:type II toxin-antitoxin system Phd/YefM family antitoxin [Phycisphaerales bacterium]